MSEASTRTHGWDRSLAAIASGSAVPYGYTVTLWSSGAVLTHAHGAPDNGRVALFIVGALSGYGLFGGVARRRGVRSTEALDGHARVVAGMLNWVGVFAAVATAWLASNLPAAPAWALGSAAPTLVYLTAAAVQLGVAETRDAGG